MTEMVLSHSRESGNPGLKMSEDIRSDSIGLLNIKSEKSLYIINRGANYKASCCLHNEQ